MKIWNNVSRPGNLSRRQALQLLAAAGGGVATGQSGWTLALPSSGGSLSVAAAVFSRARRTTQTSQVGALLRN